MRILIAAGGTGGHIYPGIAVAKEIKNRHPAAVVSFVGTSRGLEARIVPENGFELLTIESMGLKNVGLIGKIRGLLVLPKSLYQSLCLIRRFRPDVVVGAGGYVSGPVLLMASLMRIPTIIMDSNALPGFTNRLLAPFVTKAALTFEEALPFFGKKGIVVGNPVRQEFFDIPSRPINQEELAILIFGGSQGARAINDAMLASLQYLGDYKNKLKITHQTGELDFQRVKKAYEDAGWKDVEVVAYIKNMPEQFAKTDLVICRAGATTCAELAAAGKASIMVPLPTAADDHQRKNAEALQRIGATEMILQKDLNGKLLAEKIVSFASSPEKVAKMGESAKQIARKDATQRAVDLIEEVAGLCAKQGNHTVDVEKIA